MERNYPDNPSVPSGLFKHLATNQIFCHASCYKSMKYKSDNFKRDKSSTDWNA